MKQFLLLIAFIANVLPVFSQQKEKLERPKLVVGIVVDQMRWDYLYRYYDSYGKGGFKKLMNDGYNCQSTMINYLPSFTGPGHACIYTGSVPSIHGIAANDWIDGVIGGNVYCVDDKRFRSINGSVKSGYKSPVNMLTTTVTDELRIATKQKAKVFGIGLKDRGSILPAGHSANGAFWFDDSTGNFVTSAYYMSELPNWLDVFNNKRLADTFINRTWSLLYDKDSYVNSTADNTSFEGKFPNEQEPSFPHKVSRSKSGSYGALRYMPLGNTITLRAAKACIKGEQLGSDDVTDFLCVTMSTTDYAGHMYGPDALEMEDMYLRLDKSLASFFRYLDRNVGQGNYTVFLTADHGVAHNDGYMKSLKIPSGHQRQSIVVEELNEFLLQKYGQKHVVKTVYNYQVYINNKVADSLNIERNELVQTISSWLRSQEGVAYVIDFDNIDKSAVPKQIREMVVNGYHKGRSGSIQIIMKPGWYSGSRSTGTTHGTWNPYDAHIPLLWYGWGVKKGETYENVNMTDIAPTVSALLRIQMPNGCVGNVIEGVIK